MKPMIGTSGATFDVIATTPAGRVGYRPIGDGQFRVRVEPAPGVKLPFSSGWKTPADGYPRYSTVVYGLGSLTTAVAEAQTRLVQASGTVGKQVVDEAAQKLAAAKAALAEAQAAYDEASSYSF